VSETRGGKRSREGQSASWQRSSLFGALARRRHAGELESLDVGAKIRWKKKGRLRGQFVIDCDRSNSFASLRSTPQN